MKMIHTILACLFLTAAVASAGHIEIRVSIKYFSATNDPAIGTAANAAITNANRVLDRQGRGLRLKLQEVIRLNPSLTLPSRTYWLNSSTSVQVSLFSWGQWWQDSDPNTDCDQPPPDLVNVSPNQLGPYDQTINRGDVLAGLWRQAMCNNKTTFVYRDNACNVYVIWGGYCGGVGSFPSDSSCTDNLFYVSGLGDNSLTLHEWGHWASLRHPFESTELAGIKNAVGDDDLDDTPEDAWEVTPLLFPLFGGVYLDFVNSVAQALYGSNFSTLNTAQADQVLVMGKIAQIKWITGTNWVVLNAAQQAELRLVWQNIMSYHKGAPPEEQWLFTEQQLDKAADSMAQFATRSTTATGRYWFFGGPTTDGTKPLGSSKRPHVNITNAIIGNASLAAGDIVIGRPGNYPVPGPNGTSLRLNKPCTIRATRGENVPGAQSGAFRIYGH